VFVFVCGASLNVNMWSVERLERGYCAAVVARKLCSSCYAPHNTSPAGTVSIFRALTVVGRLAERAFIIMFHRSIADHPRNWYSQTLGHDTEQGGVAALLSHNAKAVALQQQPEHAARKDNVRQSFQPYDGSPVDPALSAYGRRAAGEIAQKARARGSEMDLAMHGVGSIAASKRTPHSGQQRGSQMQALMSGARPPSEEALDDPFAHVRGGGRRRVAAQTYPTDPLALINAGLGSAAEPSLPSVRAVPPSEDDLAHAVNQAYDALMTAVTSAPRDADGSLSAYSFVFDILHGYGLQLGTDGAGTLIASCDVRGGIPFREFLKCLGLVPSMPATSSQSHAQQVDEQQLPPAAPAPAPVWTAGGNKPNAPHAGASGSLRDLAAAPGGLSGASVQLARLLNGSPSQNARRNNLAREAAQMSPAVGEIGGRIF
jgi:hypothetical protein